MVTLISRSPHEAQLKSHTAEMQQCGFILDSLKLAQAININ
jgi:hypothetical protein